MFTKPSGMRMKMYDKRDGNNLIQVYGFIKQGKELIFIMIKFILAILKNICQRKLFMCYHIDTTPLLVDMDGCY